MQPRHRYRESISLVIAILLALATRARAAGLLLYETDATDIGTASAGRAAIAQDASTAAANPAGMTLLDRTQLMASPGALLPFSNFDLAPQTTTPGDGGGNAGVFTPAGGFFYVYKVNEKLRLGVAADSDFGLSANDGKDWAGR
jgi:long-chain fatty acid transport protein